MILASPSARRTARGCPKARGVPVEFLVFDDEGHGLAKLKNKLAAYPAVVEFLDRHCRQARAGAKDPWHQQAACPSLATWTMPDSPDDRCSAVCFGVYWEGMARHGPALARAPCRSMIAWLPRHWAAASAIAFPSAATLSRAPMRAR